MVFQAHGVPCSLKGGILLLQGLFCCCFLHLHGFQLRFDGFPGPEVKRREALGNHSCGPVLAQYATLWLSKLASKPTSEGVQTDTEVGAVFQRCPGMPQVVEMQHSIDQSQLWSINSNMSNSALAFSKQLTGAPLNSRGYKTREIACTHEVCVIKDHKSFGLAGCPISIFNNHHFQPCRVSVSLPLGHSLS